MTDIHHQEHQHRIGYYRELIEAKRDLVKQLSGHIEYLEGTDKQRTTLLDLARLKIEAINVRNELFYHERELKACENRASEYEKHMKALAQEAANEANWKTIELQVSDALRRVHQPEHVTFFKSLKSILDTRQEMSEKDKVAAYQLLKNRLANQK